MVLIVLALCLPGIVLNPAAPPPVRAMPKRQRSARVLRRCDECRRWRGRRASFSPACWSLEGGNLFRCGRAADVCRANRAPPCGRRRERMTTRTCPT